MTIEEAVRTLLLASPDVRTLVGAGGVYPNQAPMDAGFPRIIYQEADRETVMTHEGPVSTNRYGMDLSCQAQTYATAKQLARYVRKAMIGHRGSSSGLRVLGCFLAGETDEPELPQHGDERGILSVGVSLTLWFHEPE